MFEILCLWESQFCTVVVYLSNYIEILQGSAAGVYHVDLQIHVCCTKRWVG